MKKKLEIPNFLFFVNDNPFTGGEGDFNFNITPDKENDILKCKTWYGIFNCENSEIVAEREFSLDEENYEQMKKWLEDEHQK